MNKVLQEKKIIIVFVIFIMVLLFILIKLYNNKKINYDKNSIKSSSPANSVQKVVEDTVTEVNIDDSNSNDEDIEDEQEQENTIEPNTKNESNKNVPNVIDNVPKSNSSTSNHTTSNSNNDNSDSTSSDNNSDNEVPPSVPESPPVVEDNSVRTNDIFYRIHKGRIDYTDLDTCQSETLNLYIKYMRNINNLNYIEVMSNSDKILGYFVQYVFKEASYDNYEECNNIGNSIKASLSDRVTSYQCNERDNSYYLKIFTDYD